MLPRDLPQRPAWTAPVEVARPPAGTDLLEVAKREQLARKQANARLLRFGQWYDELRDSYAGE